MSTYAAKLRQQDGSRILEIGSDGQVEISLNGNLDATISQVQDGTVVVAAAALAIPTTHAIVTKSTGGAETLTLADGYNGQELTLTMTAAVGTGTLTPVTATGWVTMLLIAAGDTATFRFVNSTVGWIVTGTTGVLAGPLITLS